MPFTILEISRGAKQRTKRGKGGKKGKKSKAEGNSIIEVLSPPRGNHWRLAFPLSSFTWIASCWLWFPPKKRRPLRKKEKGETVVWSSVSATVSATVIFSGHAIPPQADFFFGFRLVRGKMPALKRMESSEGCPSFLDEEGKKGPSLLFQKLLA